MTQRTDALATRLEEGAAALAAFANTLTAEEWQTPLPHDGRKVGVVVHHVAIVYPLEIQFARSVAAGKPEPITADAINQMNAGHAKQYDTITKAETLDLIATNSAAAAAAIRSLTDDELDSAAFAGICATFASRLPISEAMLGDRDKRMRRLSA